MILLLFVQVAEEADGGGTTLKNAEDTKRSV
jgi:hypothetical protein